MTKYWVSIQKFAGMEIEAIHVYGVYLDGPIHAHTAYNIEIRNKEITRETHRFVRIGVYCRKNDDKWNISM